MSEKSSFGHISASAGITAEPFAVGDVVRVKDPNSFLVAFGNKIRDRDAVIERIFGSYAILKFQKRGGRGKEFTERMQMRDLMRKTPA